MNAGHDDSTTRRRCLREPFIVTSGVKNDGPLVIILEKAHKLAGAVKNL
jgi:hypothetical protein